ncbi:Hypothetical protein R9X50_00328900 [Acrodontium crateriforme]|uniref:Uncharacterized protein n=1 Tax=Acrodontium crateriforme TaxID=150365 RepID=A0AAQ3M318_9PEZI|nr:Hypothetical protein R9X50_00328900 [Acrodontium crateriforme]
MQSPCCSPHTPLGIESSHCVPLKSIEQYAAAMARAQHARSPSSELGPGDFAVDYNSRTGRPNRKLRAPAHSPFLDSALAMSDGETEEEECGASRSRKRRRSPSPALPVCPDEYARMSGTPDIDTDDDAIQVHGPAKFPQLPAQQPPQQQLVRQITIKDVTINIPAGHQGPIMLHLDAGLACSTTFPTDNSQEMLLQRTAHGPSKRLRTQDVDVTSAPRPKRAGFLDLPAELRNEIYRMAFVRKNRLNFGSPKNFSRSAAFLRTCSQVHQEGREILYGENEFYFNRRTSRYGSFWEDGWRELGFKSVRQFVKSIGVTNLSLMRHVSFQFDDATPCLNPGNMTHEERRFVHDDVLISILRHLGDYAQLQRFDMNFHGRRRVERSDDRFLDCMKRIQADDVRFVPYPIGLQTAYAMESKQEESVRKMLLKSMIRKTKLYDQ